MFELLLGHLVGDYLLQTRFMALNKTKNSLIGYFAAIIHCILYTVAICVFTQKYSLIWIVAVFCSHFFIDKYGLGELYLKYVKQDGLIRYLQDTNWTDENRKRINYTITRFNVLEGSFATIVYVVTDNTLHLLLMWGAYQIIY